KEKIYFLIRLPTRRETTFTDKPLPTYHVTDYGWLIEVRRFHDYQNQPPCLALYGRQIHDLTLLREKGRNPINDMNCLLLGLSPCNPSDNKIDF
ncbi:hypothetical protein, partial [Legionella tunisiensis]|uniref:hypothetical protein n=1 Tax=Legionella tunisiensis TaxID=1034944 RepID=UPI001E49421E